MFSPDRRLLLPPIVKLAAVLVVKVAFQLISIEALDITFPTLERAGRLQFALYIGSPPTGLIVLMPFLLPQAGSH